MFKLIFYLVLLMLLLKTTNLLKDNEEESARKLKELHDELDREYRQAMCCKKKLSCCTVQLPNLPNIEIRAVLVRCPNIKPCAADEALRRKYEPVCAVHEHNIRQFEGFDEDEPLTDLTLKKCRKKVMITIRISKTEFDPKRNHYIVVDHVYDPTGGKYTRIFTPFILKMKQEPTLQMYEMKFLHVVNSKVREKILNKRTPNYKGCYTTPSNPTCGKLKYGGKMIPYSHGFCCSCDQITNYIKQPESLQQYAYDPINFGDPKFLLGGIECPRSIRGCDSINKALDLVENDKDEAPNRDDQNANYEKEWVSPLKKMKYHNLWPNTMNSNQPNSAKNYSVKIYTSNVQSNFEPYETKKKSKNGVFKLDDELKGKYMGLENKTHKTKRENAEPALEYFSDKNSELVNDKIKNLNSMLKTRKAVHSRLYRRQVQAGGTQRRGGQNCADRWTPKDVDPIKYHESTHCLRFSDLWYTVYHLQPPMINHVILFQMFVKHFDPSGHSVWKDLTQNKIVRISSMGNKYVSDLKRFTIRYIPEAEKMDYSSFALNYKSALFLVPENVPKNKLNLYPEAKAGFPEYLIVHASQVSLEGDQCNVAGVGFEAFFKQPNRCAKRRGSCLSNQPYDLWLHDHQAEKLKLRGCFFLKNFGKLPLKPVRRNNQTGDKFLSFEYSHPHSMKIDLEIKSDYNAILRKESTAKISEVYVDCATTNKVVITIKLTNTGLVSSKFMTRMTDCPLEIPAVFSNVHSKFELVPPQHQHIYKFEIMCQLPWDRFHCSIEALNYKYQLAALRRIRLQRYDRCICSWHCLCACTGSYGGLSCSPMSSQHYHAAGFQGSMPITSFTIHYTFFEDALSFIMYITVALVTILLFLGLCKALIGLCCIRYIGNFGLNVIFHLPKPMDRYYDRDLKDDSVVYDKQGYPINPKTKKRVRNISASTEFCVNVLFFFIYPLTVAIVLTKRVCCPQYLKEDQKDEDVPCLTGADYTCDCRTAEVVLNYNAETDSNSVRKRSKTSDTTDDTLDTAKLSTIVSIQDEEESSPYSSTENEDSSYTDQTEEGNQ